MKFYQLTSSLALFACLLNHAQSTDIDAICKRYEAAKARVIAAEAQIKAEEARVRVEETRIKAQQEITKTQAADERDMTDINTLAPALAKREIGRSSTPVQGFSDAAITRSRQNIDDGVKKLHDSRQRLLEFSCELIPTIEDMSIVTVLQEKLLFDVSRRIEAMQTEETDAFRATLSCKSLEKFLSASCKLNPEFKEIYKEKQSDLKDKYTAVKQAHAKFIETIHNNSAFFIESEVDTDHQSFKAIISAAREFETQFAAYEDFAVELQNRSILNVTELTLEQQQKILVDIKFAQSKAGHDYEKNATQIDQCLQIRQKIMQNKYKTTEQMITALKKITTKVKIDSINSRDKHIAQSQSIRLFSDEWLAKIQQTTTDQFPNLEEVSKRIELANSFLMHIKQRIFQYYTEAQAELKLQRLYTNLKMTIKATDNSKFAVKSARLRNIEHYIDDIVNESLAITVIIMNATVAEYEYEYEDDLSS